MNNNYTVAQILNTIEYGTSGARGTYKEAEAQRVAVLNAMGVHGTKSKVPVEAHGECTYGEVLVMDRAVGLKYTLKPSAALTVPKSQRHRWDDKEQRPIYYEVRTKVSTHRLFVRCPWCLTDQPIGRLHQHLGSKPCKEKMKTIYG